MDMDRFDDKHIKKLLSDVRTQRKGFELLVRQYSEKLYWQVRRIVLTHDDANDVLQNVYIKAWNGIDTFHGDSKLFTWLSRIAINESLDFVRRQKTMSAVNADDGGLSIASMLMADEYFDGDRTVALLQEAVASLPDVQRTVFCLRYYDNMKYSEMSLLLDTSEGALKASYHIAVGKITQFFKEHD